MPRFFSGVGNAGRSVAKTAQSLYMAEQVAGHNVVGSMWGAIKSSSHGRAALIGAGIGAGTSGIYGAATGQGFFGSAARGAVVGAGVGAGTRFVRNSIKMMPPKVAKTTARTAATTANVAQETKQAVNNVIKNTNLKPKQRSTKNMSGSITRTNHPSIISRAQQAGMSPREWKKQREAQVSQNHLPQGNKHVRIRRG